MTLGGHAQVHQAQHHEDEGLQRDDQDVERGPAEIGDELADAEWPGRERAEAAAERHHRDQDEDQLARVHVAEQSQAQRNRAHAFLDQAQQQVRDDQEDLPDESFRVERRGEEFAEELADADVDDSRAPSGRRSEARTCCRRS